jgi:hypothetical protein
MALLAVAVVVTILYPSEELARRRPWQQAADLHCGWRIIPSVVLVISLAKWVSQYDLISPEAIPKFAI